MKRLLKVIGRVQFLVRTAFKHKLPWFEKVAIYNCSISLTFKHLEWLLLQIRSCTIWNISSCHFVSFPCLGKKKKRLSHRNEVIKLWCLQTSLLDFCRFIAIQDYIGIIPVYYKEIYVWWKSEQPGFCAALMVFIKVWLDALLWTCKSENIQWDYSALYDSRNWRYCVPI